MSDHVEQIKSRLDIVDVISGYLKVQKSGVNFKARCPFHNEKSPSFYISPERQMWHCFGCSKGGDMFSFVQEIEGAEFPEALRILAQRAGVTLERFDATIRDSKSRLYEVCELASKFFEKQLFGAPTGQKALVYLRDRGLTEATIKEFRLGFAPNDWHALGSFLQGRGYSDKELLDAGLVIAKDKGHYDRFRSRITFPIFEASGQIVGFTARVFITDPTIKESDLGAKYINTPQTLIYDKSRVLYGLSKAKAAIKQADRCLLVEGNMDAIMSYQGGVQNVVATSGTALTPHQLRMLQRYTTHLDFCFDTDQAGALATRRGIGLALSQNFAIRVVEIGDADCKDPADYVRKYGEKWGERVQASKPVIDFYYQKARTQFNPADAESKKIVIAAIAPLVKRLTSRVERSHWVSQLAAFLRVPEAAVEADLVSAKDDLEIHTAEPQDLKTVIAAPATQKNVTIDMLSEALLSIVVYKIPLFQPFLAQAPYEFLDARVGSILQTMAIPSTEPPTLDAVLAAVGTNDHTLEFTYLKSQELWKDFSDENLTVEFHNLVRTIRHKGIIAQLANLEFDIKEAEGRQDAQQLHELAQRFMTLTVALLELQKPTSV